LVNKEHQLRWLAAGGAMEQNALQPIEAKARAAGDGGEARGRVRGAGRDAAEGG
jgi:hypothetical protein